MADVRGVGQGGVKPAEPQSAEQQVGKTGAQPFDPKVPTGPAGPLGQPTGMPLPVGPGKTLSDVSTGRDPSQLTAAELLRENGGVSATDKLLGLDKQPSVLGALIAPPGNAEALRHMTPTMRRTAMRNLLQKQRELMRLLERKLREEQDEEDDDQRDTPFDASAESNERRKRAKHELGRAGMMLNLLEELLTMQDYTISQMGTFSKG